MLNMTSSGEELTPKGESVNQFDSVLSYNKSLSVSYATDSTNRNKVEIKISGREGHPSDCYQMVFVLKGKINYNKDGETKGKLKISAQQHNLCRIALKSTRISMSSIHDDIMCINLSDDFISRYIPANHPAYRRLLAQKPVNAMLVLATQNMPITPEINSVLQRIGSITANGFTDELILESKVIELLALQVYQFEQLQSKIAPAQLKSDELQRMMEAREILIHHTGGQLSLRSLAHLVGTNEFNLKRDFKVAFGNTVYGYLTQYKMEKAKAMLIEKDISIEEISKKIGYKHATHFTTAFKKYFGYLPKKIRSIKLGLFIFAEDIFFMLEKLDIFIY